ncbi:alpha-(1,3)-fucosyltransferase 10-like isoform X2 [Haliotis rubra]|uniref:alpha-(1,3)-fucosyltransferase 10-like isoform X2 n=1 Tax=Haliotis rubra TaxID=36100 RepID=UPI001EE616F7|nr:alpha-(1,3)-fucosyltransferase 10-like isoform X2 [Haliotis rubra]
MSSVMRTRGLFMSWRQLRLIVFMIIGLGSSAHKDENPIIMWWDSMGNIDRLTSCGKYTCQITVNRARMTEQSHMAYIFDGTSFGETGFPFPRQRGDIWGLFMNESPKNNEWLISQDEVIYLFNYTSTFRRESHCPFPTQWLSDINSLTDVTYLVRTSEKTRLRKEEGLAPIIYVHSDCVTPSDRRAYLQMLQKYVQVDSYGPCDHNKDFPNSTNFGTMAGMLSPEFHRFVAQYKFAFAFENAVCPDYITEKLWRPLVAGTVPIVFGSPTVKDFLPAEKSAIVITDFDNIEDVARHINYLDQHDDEYEKYLQYKKTGIQNEYLIEVERKKALSDGIDIFRKFECFLCRKLHDAIRNHNADEDATVSQGERTHYGCPTPLMFNADGQYVVPRNSRDNVYKKARHRSKAIKHFHDRNINATFDDIENYAKMLPRTCHHVHDEL